MKYKAPCLYKAMVGGSSLFFRGAYHDEDCGINVLMLPHMAFYTENAISDMVEHSICHILNAESNIRLC